MLRKLFLASLIATAGLATSPAMARCTTASYYGPGFHGNRTASGERFNQWALTAASRYLPFGTRVRVTNRYTGKSVVVRINDRGPFVGGRGIDLSTSSFSAIAPTSQGVADVCYTVL